MPVPGESKEEAKGAKEGFGARRPSSFQILVELRLSQRVKSRGIGPHQQSGMPQGLGPVPSSGTLKGPQSSIPICQIPRQKLRERDKGRQALQDMGFSLWGWSNSVTMFHRSACSPGKIPSAKFSALRPSRFAALASEAFGKRRRPSMSSRRDPARQ